MIQMFLRSNFKAIVSQSRTALNKFRVYISFMYSNKSPAIKEWIPQSILRGDGSFALLLLNQPLNAENKTYVKQNWNSAVVRVAVDGGANHLKEIFENDMLQPNFVCGDFDSISPENLKFFIEKGTKIIPTPVQDETDFTKALKLILKYLSNHNLEISYIVSVARNGDRLDHLLSNLNTLFCAVEWTSVPIFILGNGTLTWLLTEGLHKIQVPNEMKDSNVGLIPLGKECTNVTTKGLKWNLTNDKMKFGRLISTSNRFDDDATEVIISTDTELIWTMEVKMS